MNSPAWYLKPTGPGLWLCVGGEKFKGALVGMRFKQRDLDLGAPFDTIKVYGPIPEGEPIETTKQDQQPTGGKSDASGEVCEGESAL